jgi:hypothetical protein
MLGVLAGLMLMANSAQAATINVGPGEENDYATLQEAVDNANPDGSDTIELNASVTLSQQVTVESPVTIDGNGNTVSASFQKTSPSNNSAIGIVGTTGVTIENVIFDGTGGTAWPLQLHGVNVYRSTGINLNTVTVRNFMGSGVVVNGSNVSATNLNTSGNSWNAVNVDPGSGVTEPSVFTLNSGVLGENAQIWSDGVNVTGTATVTVNADGYTEYSVHGTPKKLWSNKGVSNGATINGGNVIYSSIQAAIDAAVAGNTINIGAGTYNQSVLIDKALNLDGGSGERPVISGGAANYIVKVDNASGTVLKNLEVNGGGSSVGANNFDYGILINNSANVEIRDFVVKNIWKNSSNGIGIEGSASALVHNNVISSFHKRGIRFINSSGKFYDNEVIGDNVDGTLRVQNLVNLWGGSTVEVYGNVLHNALTLGGTPTWDSPAIFISSFGGAGDSHANVHDNEIYDSDTGIVVTSVFAATDNSSAMVTNNNFHNLEWAINFETETGSATVNNNAFENVGKAINAETSSGLLANPPEVNAENNWWGSTNPEFASLVYEGVDFTPWYIGPTITLNGDPSVSVFSSNGYIDEEATAVDLFGASVTVTDNSDSLNFTQAGSYTITYSATDMFGNTSTADRTVIVNPTNSGRGGGSRGNSAGAASSQAAVATANAGVNLPPQATLVIGEVLGATTSAETEAKIVSVKTELREKISQLIGLLQAQLAAAIAAGAN